MIQEPAVNRTPSGDYPPPRIGPDPLARFISVSAALTGFSQAELQGTGMAQEYYNVMRSTLSEPLVGRLLLQWTLIEKLDSYLHDEYLTNTILGDETLGPMARNLITLWYLGQWWQLPVAWRQLHGANAQDTTRVVSAQAYEEGLVWVAMGVHPQGAKQPGFGSWALEPAPLPVKAT